MLKHQLSGAPLALLGMAAMALLAGCGSKEPEATNAQPATSVQSSLQNNPNVPEAAKQGAMQDMDKARARSAEAGKNAAEMKKAMEAHGIH